MNKQRKGPDKRGIEWTDYTWNPVAGCKHACRWRMPDGTVARCYAEAVAEGVAAHAYQDGFAAHYYYPQRLSEPAKVSAPSRIFLDSMSDLMGAWVPDEQRRAVFDVVRECHWHQFQLLTKAPGRVAAMANEDLPPNLWVGVSSPPTFMMGRELTDEQRARYVSKTMKAFEQLRGVIRWLSLEPLAFDVAPMLDAECVDWIVVGAASDGRRKFQPEPEHVQNVIDWADRGGVPVFFKGNLDWAPHREEFPTDSVGR